MSFGFSIGDFITVAEIAWKTYTALRDASEDFDGFASEVHSLYTALICLRDEAISPSSILQYAAPQKISGLKDIIENCENSLLQLQKKAKTVCLLKPGQRRQFWESLKLAFKDKQGPRDRIAIHTASVNMFLSSLTHNSLGRLEFLLKNALQSPSSGFSITSNLPRGPDGGSENTWNQIGQDLLMEGISERYFREFSDEIKAYIRYLVHGGNFLSEKNFRLDRSSPELRKTDERVHAQLPELRKMEKNEGKAEARYKIQFMQAGYSEEQAEAVLRKKRNTKKKEQNTLSRPTWIRVERKWLLPETLDYYNLPWEWDESWHLTLAFVG